MLLIGTGNVIRVHFLTLLSPRLKWNKHFRSHTRSKLAIWLPILFMQWLWRTKIFIMIHKHQKYIVCCLTYDTMFVRTIFTQKNQYIVCKLVAIDLMMMMMMMMMIRWIAHFFIFIEREVIENTQHVKTGLETRLNLLKHVVKSNACYGSWFIILYWININIKLQK